MKKRDRFLIVGCSHGVHISEKAREAVLEMRKLLKPKFVAHLGDFCDTAAFRSGAKGSNDESEPVAPDIDGGLAFLKQLRPNVVLLGNHEDRLWKLAHHHNAIVAHCAATCVNEINDTCKEIGANVVEYGGIWQEYRFMDYRLMHGAFYNENACRDHAESFGNVIFAHTHRAGFAIGRRSDQPKGFCVGTLSGIRGHEYAKARRATLSWHQAIVWGEYDDRRAYPQLLLGPGEGDKNAEWVLI